ncbi:uncharacterized protein LOC126385982 isoform X2 [Epinephelus moara]|uniref:uncharacterized protein LOC126385982 isoform X2 n=1 Tax=Epinephelus moara TaxID=300413 RepID=UPI00214E4E4F|nr:uncharacterized protein LOC126385982 isoform X2 [Epinephelus moara]
MKLRRSQGRCRTCGLLQSPSGVVHRRGVVPAGCYNLHQVLFTGAVSYLWGVTVSVRCCSQGRCRTRGVLQSPSGGVHRGGVVPVGCYSLRQEAFTGVVSYPWGVTVSVSLRSQGWCRTRGVLQSPSGGVHRGGVVPVGCYSLRQEAFTGVVSYPWGVTVSVSLRSQGWCRTRGVLQSPSGVVHRGGVVPVGCYSLRQVAFTGVVSYPWGVTVSVRWRSQGWCRTRGVLQSLSFCGGL